MLIDINNHSQVGSERKESLETMYKNANQSEENKTDNGKIIQPSNSDQSSKPNTHESNSKDPNKVGIVKCEGINLVVCRVTATIQFGNLKKCEWDKYGDCLYSYVSNSLTQLVYTPGLFGEIDIDDLECWYQESDGMTANTVIKLVLTSEEFSMLSDELILNLLKSKLRNCGFSAKVLDDCKAQDQEVPEWNHSFVPTAIALDISDQSTRHDVSYLRYAVRERYLKGWVPMNLTIARMTIGLLLSDAENTENGEKICESLRSVISDLDQLENPAF